MTQQNLFRARAFLSAVAEAPAPALARFVAECGAESAAERVLAGTVPDDVSEEVEARRRRVTGERVLAAAESVGARLVVPEQPEWPHERFEALSRAPAVGLTGLAEPLALWVRGNGSLAALANGVAIVGTRAASAYGEQLAREFGHGLAGAGAIVISGAAYGIDGAAHRGALAAGAPTVGFLACGLDHDYPAGHSRLLAAIAEEGLVVSEYPPATPPRKHRFLVRNRLIAAAGRATVVVEAGARSGAGNTSTTADTLGRPVLAVPGPVTSVNSIGCHQMIRSGKAMLVTTVAEIREVLEPLGAGAMSVEGVTPARKTDELDRLARQLHDALTTRDGASAEQLAYDCGLPLRKVRALLPMLEMSGLAVRNERGWCRCPH